MDNNIADNSLAINQVKYSFCCPRGHKWEDAYQFGVSFDIGDFHEVYHCCPFCLLDALKQSIPESNKMNKNNG